MPPQRALDIQKAFDFGNLIDGMITEPHNVNYFKRTWEHLEFNKEDFNLAIGMRQAFLDDPFCRQITKVCNFQYVTVRERFEINYNGIKFWIPARCKWDFISHNLPLSGDIKSTVCTSESACRSAIGYFNYDRSRAYYMDLENRDKDVLIFITKEKKPKVFKIHIKRGDELYTKGKEKYAELAFKWLILFGDIKNQIISA